VVLGPVRENYVAQLKLLNQAIFPVRYQESFYKDCLAAGDVTQLAFYQDVLVGAVACRLEAPPGGAEGKGKLYIMTLGVLSPYRGQGVGRRLLMHTLAEARKQNQASEVYLHVQTNNDDAVNFYKKHDFEITETIKGYYRKIDPPDCYVLSFKL
jgi:ribosomal protein S18 acetylase RimI-like enzyme